MPTKNDVEYAHVDNGIVKTCSMKRNTIGPTAMQQVSGVNERKALSTKATAEGFEEMRTEAHM